MYERNYLGFSPLQRHNYWSDFKLGLYVVTHYKVTSPNRILFFLSSIIQKKT